MHLLPMTCTTHSEEPAFLRARHHERTASVTASLVHPVLRGLAVTIVCMSACGCLGYTGSARALNPYAWRSETGWVAVDGVPLFRQRADHDCGPTALAMVLAYWHKASPPDREPSSPPEQQASAGQLRDQARARGMSAFVVEGTLVDIAHELKQQRPVIVGVAKPSANGAVAHFEVVVGLHPQTRRIATLDPAAGWRQNSLTGFMREWMPTGRVLLVVLPGERKPSGRIVASGDRRGR